MRFSSLAVLVGLSACLTPTQITVKLRGVDLVCPGGEGRPLQETGLLAKPQINDPSDVSAVTITGTICKPSTDPKAVEGELDLGDAVLVPQDGPGPVEVLAIGALNGHKADECRAEYARLFNEAEPCKEGETCRSCIFARRSLAFVEHSSLEVRVELEPSCAGVVCDASQTCTKGVCVSAETSCTEANGCELTSSGNGGAGGAGAGPSVGGGGAGPIGGGGAGGGAVSDWEPWHTGMTYDVVGNDVSRGEAFQLFAAAGSQMISFEASGTPTFVGAMASVATYRAVAHAKTTAGAVTMGSDGSSSDPAFSPLSNAPSSTNGALIRFGVAPYNSSEAAWVQETTQNTTLFVPGQGETTANGAGLFMAPFAQLPRLFVADTFNQMGRLRAIDSSNGFPTESLQLNTPPSTEAWSVWASPIPVGTDQVVVAAQRAEKVFSTTCTEASGTTCGFTGFFLANPHVTNLNGPILDLFGVATSSDADLYALVKDSSSGATVLARTRLSLSNGVLLPTWAVVQLSTTLGQPSALWVGKLDQNSPDAFVFVATSNGLYKATTPVDQLFP